MAKSDPYTPRYIRGHGHVYVFDVADTCGISPNTVQKACRDGTINARKAYGGWWQITNDEALDNFIDHHTGRT